MDPLAGVPENFQRLKEIAGEFKPEELNDGEASFLRERVDECLQSIRFEISDVSEISASQIGEFLDEINTVDALYQNIFTPENERSFAPIKEAHQNLDELKNVIGIKAKVPKLAESLAEIRQLTNSLKRTSRLDDQVQGDLHSFDSLYKKINKQLEAADELSNGERSWILRQLESLREAVASLYVDEEKLSRVVDDSMESIAVNDFELIENVTRVTIGFNQFDPLLDSADLKVMGKYLAEKADSFLEKIKDTPSGEKSCYLRKEDTGLLRTVQVILPEGKTDSSELFFVIQLKSHGVKPLDEQGLDPFMKRVGEGLADPLSPSEKEMPLIGKGGYKTAKHSLTIPRSAIAKSGEVDTEQIIHTTTLTPHEQSKSHIESRIVTSSYYVDKAGTEKTIESLGIGGADVIKRDVRYHKKFQGTGVLPLIGSSLYEGIYRYDDTGLLDTIFGNKRECQVHFTKSNIVTMKCDGDLSFDPDKKFTLEEKKKIAEDIIEGMIRIHEEGFMHGDMKPENVLFKKDGEGIHGYLTDFGLSDLWNAYRLYATNRYFPLNTSSDHAILCSRYDLYATGLTLLSLLIDRPVYSPSPLTWNAEIEEHKMAKKALNDDQYLNELALQKEVSPGFVKEMCEKIESGYSKTRYLVPRNILLEMKEGSEHMKVRNPLAVAFLKTFFANYATHSEFEITEEEQAFLLEDEAKISEKAKVALERGDLTVALLENLAKEIKKIESEKHIRLDRLVIELKYLKK